MNRLLGLMALLCVCVNGFGQKIKPLTIGDSVFNNIFNLIAKKSNNPLHTAPLSNRLIILDFMNTGCSSCIAALPRIDSLARKFKNNFSAFISTPENINRVKSFSEHNSIAKSISLPFVTNDTTLEKYFPHLYISHIVWIYKGKVVAITHSDYVTERHVKEVLSGTDIKWPVKRDIINYDYNSPLFAINKDGIPEYSLPDHVCYTAFTSHLGNISPRYTEHYDSVSNTTRITVVNYSLVQLYLKAFGLPVRYELSKIDPDKALEKYIHKVNDTTSITDWNTHFTYCYETSIDGRTSEEALRKKLNQDVGKQFGLSAYMKDSTVNCWELFYDSTKHEIPFDKFMDFATASKNNETSIWQIIYKMNHTIFHVPVINKTSFGTEQYIKIKEGNLNDITFVNRLIAPYGLCFKIKQNRLPILHIHIAQTNNKPKE